MRQVRDTFLHFLSENLTGKTVKLIRSDNSDPSARAFQMNAINVTFLDYAPAIGNSSVRVVLDVIYDGDDGAIDVLEALYAVLGAAYMTRIYDYTNYTTPVKQSGNLVWDRGSVRFTRIDTDLYAHYSCILRLEYAQEI